MWVRLPPRALPSVAPGEVVGPLLGRWPRRGFKSLPVFGQAHGAALLVREEVSGPDALRRCDYVSVQQQRTVVPSYTIASSQGPVEFATSPPPALQSPGSIHPNTAHEAGGGAAFATGRSPTGTTLGCSARRPSSDAGFRAAGTAGVDARVFHADVGQAFEARVTRAVLASAALRARLARGRVIVVPVATRRLSPWHAPILMQPCDVTRKKAKHAKAVTLLREMQKDAPVLEVQFFRQGSSEPVREWLQSLPKSIRHKIGTSVQAVQWRWPVGPPLVDGFGAGLYEVRRASTTTSTGSSSATSSTRWSCSTAS